MQEQSIKCQLLKQLSISWQMADGRQGDFSLDWVHITDAMRPIIQLEEVWLHTSLEMNEGSGATQVDTFHYRCHLGKLVRLLVVLKNNRAMPITPCIRIQPYLDYHNGHFDALAAPPDTVIAPATPLLVLGRSQEIFDEVVSLLTTSELARCRPILRPSMSLRFCRRELGSSASAAPARICQIFWHQRANHFQLSIRRLCSSMSPPSSWTLSIRHPLNLLNLSDALLIPVSGVANPVTEIDSPQHGTLFIGQRAKLVPL